MSQTALLENSSNFFRNFNFGSWARLFTWKTHPLKNHEYLFILFENRVMSQAVLLENSSIRKMIWKIVWMSFPVIRSSSFPRNLPIMIHWGAYSRWSSSLYCPMWNSDQMTIETTHPTLFSVNNTIHIDTSSMVQILSVVVVIIAFIVFGAMICKGVRLSKFDRDIK